MHIFMYTYRNIHTYIYVNIFTYIYKYLNLPVDQVHIVVYGFRYAYNRDIQISFDDLKSHMVINDYFHIRL
jgi:hypothetical protein